MKIKELNTPSIILDLDIFENNLKKYHELAKENNKQLWPMIKTHKSKEIMSLQKEAGAEGVLCGTLDEAEAACEVGFKNVMYAYPVSDNISIDRIIQMSKKVNFIVRIDNLKTAEIINKKAEKMNALINFTVILNSGLNRFGIEKENLIKFMESIKKFENLVFKGISSHPGHVYEAKNPSEVDKYAEDEIKTMKYAKEELLKNGYHIEIISSGSTPTYLRNVTDDTINVFHPGNYVFLDVIQISLGIASINDCALRVLSTVTSNPRKDTYMIDAGAKCLGLDKGAHGNSSIVGHGRVINTEDVIVESLSEEVGKIISKNNEIEIGQKIQIIPNHSCSTANLTSYLYCYRGDSLEKVINVDIRGNSKNLMI